MGGDLVFITGATGHVGFKVLQLTLEAGYRVRAAIRRLEKGEQLRKHPLIEPHSAQLQLVLIQDITADDAFEGALGDVKYIQHVAGVIPRQDGKAFDRGIAQVAVKGTTNLLRAAKKIPTIRRIVIASSVAGIIPYDKLMGGASGELFTSSSRVTSVPEGHLTDEDIAYHADKVAALAEAERFFQDEQPHFSIVHLMPGYVIGPKYLATDARDAMSGSNITILAVLLGKRGLVPLQRNLIGLTDTARIHVEALDEQRVKGSELFILDAHVTYESVSDIVRAKLPAVVEKGYLPLGGSVKAIEVPCDTENTVRAFGKLESFDDDVADLVKQFLELKGKTVESRQGLHRF